MQLFKPVVSGLFAASGGLGFPLTINIGDDGQSPIPVVQGLPGEKPVPGGSPVSVCDISEPKLLTIDELIIDPNPPQKGANLSIDALGFLQKSIVDGAYVVVYVKYGYIKLLEKTFDLCEEIQNVDLTCPLEAGPQSISKQVEIPNEVPPGKYTVYARAFNADEEYIACLTATVVFTVDSFSLTNYAKFAKRMIMGF